MTSSPITRFFGGSPLWVIARLAFVSLLVGLAFSILNIEPFDILYWFHDLALRIYDLGFEAFADLIRYFLLGAIIVFPLWLVMRTMKLLGGGKSGATPGDIKPPR